MGRLLFLDEEQKKRDLEKRVAELKGKIITCRGLITSVDPSTPGSTQLVVVCRNPLAVYNATLVAYAIYTQTPYIPLEDIFTELPYFHLFESGFRLKRHIFMPFRTYINAEAFKYFFAGETQGKDFLNKMEDNEKVTFPFFKII